MTIKVVCRELVDGKYPGAIEEGFIFTPDVSELTSERRYNGKEYNYYVYQYNLPDHPNWSDKWFTPKGSGADVFLKTMAYCPPNGLNKGYNGPVKEIGEYYICYEADSFPTYGIIELFIYI